MESRRMYSKRLVAIGGSVLLSTLLAACGSRAAAPATSASTPTSTATATALVTAPPTTVLPTTTPATALVTTTPATSPSPVPSVGATGVPAGTLAASPVPYRDVVFAALQPAPGSTGGRSAVITFTVRAPQHITAVHLSLDGKPVTPEVGGRDERDLSAFYQPPHWDVGQHTVVATAIVSGRTFSRTWSFTIA